MSFQDARNLEGEKNDKGYQVGVSMTGRITALIDPTRIFTSNGKPTQRIQLLDVQGESCKVKVFLGNGPDILAADVNTMQSFTDLAMNRYKGNVSYMAFWDNMHPPQGQQPAPAINSTPPQGQATPTQLNAATQAIIDRHREPQPAAEQIMDHMAGPATPTEPPASSTIPDSAPIMQNITQPTQADYEAKERKKVIGMCMHGYIVAEINRRPITEVWDDKDAVQAAWKLANICVDGMGQVVDGEPKF